MIEVIVDGKTAKEKLFNDYLSEHKRLFLPKNDEIRKYCEFLKSYYPNNSKKKQIILIHILL